MPMPRVILVRHDGSPVHRRRDRVRGRGGYGAAHDRRAGPPFPGLGNQIDEGMAVAIDGEIYQDAWQAPLGPDSEIVLIPKIGGG